MTGRKIFVMLAAVWLAPGFAAAGEKPPRRAQAGVPDVVASSANASEEVNLKISYRMRLDALESSGSVIVQSGAQTNSVVKEDVSYPSDAAGGVRADDARRGAGGVLAQPGTQPNNAVKADVPAPSDAAAGKSVEYAKRGAVLNCLPTLVAKGKKANVQLQAEMNVPLAALANEKTPRVKLFQYQSTFLVELGRTLVLADGPDRHLEVMVEALPAQ